MDKFDAFIQGNIATHRRLKEATVVIERLSDEILISNSVEGNLRKNLTLTQDRNASMQREINGLRVLQAQFNKHIDMVAKQEFQTNFLEKKYQELRDQIEQKIKSVRVEENLLGKIRELEKRLEEKDNNYNLIKMENSSVLHREETTVRELQGKLDRVTNELEKTKLDCEMLKNDTERVQLLHNKQIMDYDEKLRKYEEDRSLIQSDLPSVPKNRFWDRKASVTWADATRRASYVSKNDIPSIRKEAITSNSEEKQQVFKFKEPLDIIAVKESTATANQAKRKRLYSNNSNHFIFE